MSDLTEELADAIEVATEQDRTYTAGLLTRALRALEDAEQARMEAEDKVATVEALVRAPIAGAGAFTEHRPAVYDVQGEEPAVPFAPDFDAVPEFNRYEHARPAAGWAACKDLPKRPPRGGERWVPSDEG